MFSSWAKSNHKSVWDVAYVAGAKRGGGGRKARKRGKGRVPSPPSPTPSLFPFFPIPYPFRRLLRRLSRTSQHLLRPGSEQNYSRIWGGESEQFPPHSPCTQRYNVACRQFSGFSDGP